MRKLPGLVWPSDYCLLLVIHVGSDEVVEGWPKAIRRDFRVLTQLVEGPGAQVVFSSQNQPVSGKNTEGNRLTYLISTSLSGTGFSGILVSLIMAPDLPATGGIHLPQRGKRILAHELARSFKLGFKGEENNPNSVEVSLGVACQCWK